MLLILLPVLLVVAMKLAGQGNPLWIFVWIGALYLALENM